MEGGDGDIQLNEIEPVDPQAEKIAELERRGRLADSSTYRSAADLENARKRWRRGTSFVNSARRVS